MITKIEGLLDKELANVKANNEICSDVLGAKKSELLSDRISAPDAVDGEWCLSVGWTKRV
jgi:hypothetical protein